MRSIDPIEVKTPLRDKLRSLKSLRSNAIIEEDVEEVAFQPPIVLINILRIRFEFHGFGLPPDGSYSKQLFETFL